MPRQRPPVDKSFGATVKVLALPVVLAGAFGWLCFTNWYGEHRATVVCDHAQAARTTGEYRAWLRSGREPWHESLERDGSSIFLTMYPGLLAEIYACRVVAVGESIKEISVDHHD